MNAETTLIYRDSEIACFLIEDLMVYRDVGVGPPEASSWKAYLREIRRFTPRVGRCLVVPRVAGLTPRQREDIRGLFGARPTAVVTGSMINRCIITSLSWFGVRIHAFAAGAYRDALRWLECEPLLPEVLRGLELYPPASIRRQAREADDSDSPPP
jgi:hypothetical protein